MAVIDTGVFYADSYPDLKNAFGYYKVALYTHWVSFGRTEGRRSSEVFNLGYYLTHNGNLLNAFGTITVQHFVWNGIYVGLSGRANIVYPK